MARVLNPLFSEDAKGSVGGLTFSKCSSGNIAKKKSKPVKRSEPYKQSNRSRIGFLARLYGLLTQGQRDSWKAWAEDHPEPDGFGGTFIMSGINAFIKLNFNAMRLQTPAAQYDSPPVEIVPASVNSLTASTGVGVAGDVDLVWTHNGVGEADDFNEIQIAGPFLSPGKKEVYSKFSFIQLTAGTLLLATVQGLDVGMWYWFRVRYVDDFGVVTAWQYSQAKPYAGA